MEQQQGRLANRQLLPAQAEEMHADAEVTLRTLEPSMLTMVASACVEVTGYANSSSRP